MRVHALCLLFAAMFATAEAGTLLGYLEDWVDMKWWDNNMPGNCRMGCFEPKKFLAMITPYSALNYGFTFLTELPSPAQVSCSNAPNGTHAKAAKPCKVWDGKAIYAANATTTGSEVVTATSGVTPGVIAISEACRMARMHKDGPKRCKVSLGGWSDFARLGSVENGKAVAKLAAKMVKMTFADGIDLDFEHLTPFSTIEGDDEFAAYIAMVKQLKEELKTVASDWSSFAQQREKELQTEFNNLPPFKQATEAPYYNTNMAYCKMLAKNGAPQLEVSWTTRFNAFLPKDDPWNYLLPGSWKPNTTFATNNEGRKVWPQLKDEIDTVNVMAYDAGPMKMNFSQIMVNFVNIGNVPKEKILIGFEPGEQAAGGIWEGLETDKETATWANNNGYGGAFVWAVNPSNITNPNGTHLCPEVANAVNKILQPKWHWGPEPQYEKCNQETGWLQ